MTLQQMTYIVALDKYRNFVLAAESCDITQPTLSSTIQKVEEELNVKLFERNRKSVTPTKIGEKIIRQAKIVINESHRIKEVIADEQDGLKGTLHIGVIPTVAPYIVPDFIQLFHKHFGNVSLFIDEMDNNRLEHELTLGNIDMGISTTLTNEQLLEIPLYQEKFVLYFSDECKEKKLLNMKQLSNENIWVLKEGHCLPDKGFQFCKDVSKGKHIYKAGSIDTLVRIVDKNGGFTIIPELHIPLLNAKQKDNIQLIDKDIPAKRTINIYIKEDYVRRKIVNAVVDVFKMMIPYEMLDKRIKKFEIKL